MFPWVYFTATLEKFLKRAGCKTILYLFVGFEMRSVLLIVKAASCS